MEPVPILGHVRTTDGAGGARRALFQNAKPDLPRGLL
jgi:hypothetical protein